MRERWYYRVFSADRLLQQRFDDGFVIADIGCSVGTGSFFLDQQKTVMGVDIHLPSLERARDSGRRDRVINADITHLPFRERALDVAVALDVLEHLERDVGYVLLGELSRVAGVAVVLTPSGFEPQEGTPEQPWMEHRSGWTARDLRDAGYEVMGAGGPRWLRRPGREGAFRFGWLGRFTALLLVPIFRSLPDRSFHLLAVSAGAPGTGRHSSRRPLR